VAQSVKRPTLGLTTQGRETEPRIRLYAQCGVCLRLPLPLPLMLSFSLCKINKSTLKKKKKDGGLKSVANCGLAEWE